eukprot:TRINITY_DN48522_c0_g1_i1.p1 TRINITY_DN48522_c0_g1~~TRINITY_DN48522_c0_g1_i1.p1  ORF type:complete len:272 (+),score=27.60 TRINITY_DN48522_c0_g1_i1:41-856(+)
MIPDVDTLQIAFKRVLRCILLGYAIEAVTKCIFLALVGAIGQDHGHNANCEEADERLVCRGWLKYYRVFEAFVIAFKACLAAVTTYRLVCRSQGLNQEVGEAVSSLLKIFAVSSCISVIFYVTQYAAAYGFLTESIRILGLLPFVSVFQAVASELGRRRLDRIFKAYTEQQAEACTRSVELPQVEWRKLRLTETGTEEQPEEEEISCSVCLIEFSPDDLVSQLPCKHCFHAECIRTWLSSSLTSRCPLRCQEDPMGLTASEEPEVIGQAAV